MRKITLILFAFTVWMSVLSTASAQISAVQTVPQTALEFNEEILQDLLKRDIETVLDKALPEFQNIENVESELTKYMGYLPAYEDGKKYIAFNTQLRRTDDSKSAEAIYRTRYELTDLNVKEKPKDSWATIDIFSQETAEGLKFRHLSFRTVPYQPTKVGTFAIKYKSFKHYVFLLLLIGVPIFIIATIVAIIRNKHMSKKWLWGIFSAFGLWGINLNWFTGKISATFITMTTNTEGLSSWNFKVISFQLLGASIDKSSQYSPYIISIGLPLGAILYWALKHQDKNIHQALE